MRVVLDSNILLVAIGRRSSYRNIWTAFIDGKYDLIVSDEIIYEYEEIIQQKSSSLAATTLVELLIESPKVIHQQIYYSWNIIKQDPDDNKFFDVAVAANADYIVTNDAHFNIVKHLSFPSIKILTASEFSALLDKL